MTRTWGTRAWGPELGGPELGIFCDITYMTYI